MCDVEHEQRPPRGSPTLERVPSCPHCDTASVPEKQPDGSWYCTVCGKTFVHYNFARIHRSLRVTPAMEAGISDRVWSLEDIVELLESDEARRAA